jgi:glycosyltransferase involved in cell wall biosynthesis
VAKLLNDEKLAAKMGQNAIMRAQEMFSLDRMINNYKTLIKKVLPDQKTAG